VEKRWILWLFTAISIALAGLIAVQVYWLRSTINLKERHYEQGIEDALIAVSERLERVEKMQDLRSHEAGRKLLLRLDTLRSGASPLRLNAGTTGMLKGGAFGNSSSASIAEEEEYEALVADMVRGILATELMRNIEDRLDPALLDSLLSEELAVHNLKGTVQWGVFDEERVPVFVPRPPIPGEDELAASPFRTRLFRHDLAGDPYYLHLNLSDRSSTVLRGVWPMLAITALFLLVILVAFAYTVRTILEQKRIGDIRNDLVNNLTHELKTPISTISLACEALADPSIPRTEQQVQRFTGMIRDENKRLGSLVENVLQSAVLEDGQMRIKRVELDLHALVQDVVRSSGMQVSRRNGRIELELGAEIHHVFGDRIHLTNLIYNLIDNAVKYTEQEPRIRIATQSNDEGVTLSVSDNGIGIAASEHRKIFDRLYRVPTGNLHNAKGFGLGLSYVQVVVERHSGRIRVESQPGKGSTFHIFIPFEHVRSDQIARSGR